jgi:hypothetical protein
MDPERSIGDTGLGERDLVSGFNRLARSLSIRPMARVFVRVIALGSFATIDLNLSGIGGTGGAME